MDEIKVGDKVTHFRDDRVGTVVEIEDDQHTWEKIYHVAWIINGPAIPYRDGLTLAEDES